MKTKDVLKSLHELKNSSYKYSSEFNLGTINSDTPINHFIKHHCKDTYDSLLFHKNALILEYGKELSIFILKEKLVIVSKFDSNQEKFEIFELIEIKRIFDIYHQEKDKKSYIKLNYIHGPTLDNMVWLTINFKNSKECLIFKLFVEKEKSNAWQTFFEKSIPIPYPYYYQCHFFLKKLRTKQQDKKILVLTNEFIINIEYQILGGKKGEELSYKLTKMKSVFSIKSLEEIIVSEKDRKKSGESIIKIRINSKTNKTYCGDKKLPFKNDSNVEIQFQNENDCNYFIYQIKKLFYNLSDKKYISYKTA